MGRQPNQSESFAAEYWRHRTKLTESRRALWRFENKRQNAVPYHDHFSSSFSHEKSCFNSIGRTTRSNYCTVTQLHKLLYRKL